MKKIKKLLSKNYKLIFVLLVIISFILKRDALAGWVFQPLGNYTSEVNNCETGNSISSACWFTNMINNTMNSGSLLLGGCSKEYDQECPEGYEQGANGVLASTVVAMTTTPPASSVEYFADLGKTLGIIPKTAYAQGFGESAIAPLLSLWKIFRNIAYLALVIVFVIIGFMIMFRKKLNPQTVITIQEAIPRIVVTLLLITFSYAIAGLVIDLTQFTTRLIGMTFVEAGLIGNVRPEEAAKNITGAQKLEALISAHTFALVNPLRNVNELTSAIRAPGGLGRGIFSAMIWFVFTFTMFFAMFKIFFALIGPFVSLVLSVVFAPLQLLITAIPGKSSLWGWLGGLIANAAVFPVTFTMLCLAAIFKSGPILSRPPGGSIIGFVTGQVDWATKPTIFGLNWAPPAIGSWGGAVGQIVGFGILLTIPKVAEVVKKLLEVKETGLGGLATEEIKKGFGRLPLGLGNVLGG